MQVTKQDSSRRSTKVAEYGKYGSKERKQDTEIEAWKGEAL